ncbi:MAG: hypothetical protein N5P05_002037 [Chroococcopsis gigantea SAG 12.99]|nr:hypothetical protein [Chroococcopsis gigantea SAG 12.99]
MKDYYILTLVTLVQLCRDTYSELMVYPLTRMWLLTPIIIF